MNDLTISAARVFLAKNIPFCIYRFPGESAVQIAVESDLLPHAPAKDFVVAPFTNKSSAQYILLKVLQKGAVTSSFVHSLSSLPPRKAVFPTLPPSSGKHVYMKQMDAFRKAIHRGIIKKAILSRVETVQKPASFDAIKIFRELSLRYPHTFVHLLNHNEGLWLGATPELLLSKKNDGYHTMALAGTRATNTQHRYQWDTKETVEQHMVEAHVESVFHDNGFDMLHKKGPDTVEAGQVAHLCTSYRFDKNGKADLTHLLQQLHPTPAVGGLPAKDAVDFVLRHEGYDRKYYCGFIGEKDRDNEARLYVNLRCMQVGDKEIAVYSGGGITEDSDPESEWEETVYKSHTMLDLVNEMNEHVTVR